MGIRGLLFDKDGTLFDFQATWGGWAASFIRSVAEDEKHARVLAEALEFDLETLEFGAESPVIAGTPSEIAGRVLPHLPGRDLSGLLRQMNAAAALAPQAQAVPLIPLIEELRARGLSIGVATNDAEEPARAHLRGAGVEERFDFIAGFDTGHGGKPGPGMCLAFCSATGLSPSEVVMVGDSTHDLLAGKAAGMRTVAVLTGMAGPERLAPLAEVVLADIGGLPEWLDSMG